MPLAQAAPDVVKLNFRIKFLSKQGDFLYVSVKSTSDVDIDVRSVVITSPLFKMYITPYPLEVGENRPAVNPDQQ